MKKFVLVIKDPYKKELSDLKNGFTSGDKNLHEKISKLEHELRSWRSLPNYTRIDFWESTRGLIKSNLAKT